MLIENDINENKFLRSTEAKNEKKERKYIVLEAKVITTYLYFTRQKYHKIYFI